MSNLLPPSQPHQRRFSFGPNDQNEKSRKNKLLPTIPTPSPPPPPVKAIQATLSPPPGQFLINTLLQFCAFAAAIAFGIFAIKSVREAQASNTYAVQALESARMGNEYASKALEQARVANQVAMLAICLPAASESESDTTLVSFCERVRGDARLVFPNAAAALFTAVPTLSKTSTKSSSITVPTMTSNRNIITSIISHSSTINVSRTTSEYGMQSGSPAGYSKSPTSPAPATHTGGENSSESSSVSSHDENKSKKLLIAIVVPIGIFLVVVPVFFYRCWRQRHWRSYKARFDAIPPPPPAAAMAAECPATYSPYNEPNQSLSDHDSALIADKHGKRKERASGGLWRRYRALFVDSKVSSRE